MGTNKAILLGHLGRDPELKFLDNELAICSFSIATNDRRRNKDGEMVEYTEWHLIKVFGKMAEACHQYLQKGRQVYIEGRIHTNKWEDKNGVTRYTTEIIALSVEFLGSKGEKVGEARADEPVDLPVSMSEQLPPAKSHSELGLVSADSLGAENI